MQRSYPTLSSRLQTVPARLPGKRACRILAISAVFVTQTTGAQTANAPDLNAAQQGIPLRANLNVTDNVSIEAVLLPKNVCSRVFGKEIANNYAAVQLTISNRSDQASLIVHSVFIDYSQWALSGFSSQASAPGGNAVQPWQANTNSSQIASVEYRIARGQLLDARPWTARNITIRALQAVGSIASAYAFAITDKDSVRGITAFSGQVVPAAEAFWPDSTIGQMNRISDIGFQVNKVVSKQSSEIIVAFFPIDRFLPTTLKKLFLKNPAPFFAPYTMLLDAASRKDLEELLSILYGKDQVRQKMKSLLDAFERGDNIALLDRISLNTVRILVDGIMTIDVNNVPATITSVDMDGGNDNASVWTEGEKTGVIKGSYLLGGMPTIAGPEPTSVTDVAVTAGSTASELHFKMKLAPALKSGQKLTFKVVKKDSKNKDLESVPFDFVIPGFKAQR